MQFCVAEATVGRSCTTTATEFSEELERSLSLLIAVIDSHSRDAARDSRVATVQHGQEVNASVEELRDRIRQEVLDRAYFAWEAECRRVGGTVHTTDWSHWFLAETQVAADLRSRLTIMSVQESGSDFAGTGESQAKQLPCSSNGTAVQIQSLPGNHTSDCCNCGGIEPSKDGDARMNSRNERTGTDAGFEIAAPSEMDLEGDFVPVVDLSAAEFENKIVLTDESETVVLAVVDSLAEVEQVASTVSFQQRLDACGRNAEFLIHNGRQRNAPVTR